MKTAPIGCKAHRIMDNGNGKKINCWSWQRCFASDCDKKDQCPTYARALVWVK